MGSLNTSTSNGSSKKKKKENRAYFSSDLYNTAKIKRAIADDTNITNNVLSDFCRICSISMISHIASMETTVKKSTSVTSAIAAIFLTCAIMILFFFVIDY